ncbi:hypothetical protein [Pontibacter sp. G13]|uniref:hypothetical protein n=1 Tax=Pontibacter sp. G13 TaxID=3074898 RepID=UPI00288BB410|nr:hypothetical protein [Pontibacter sp. G13]WNJ16620.1 hypothetical protein RJD25_17280 [Pontibacter sp. G13]
MNVLFWIFACFFGIYLTFRFFGRQILSFAMMKLTERLVKDSQAQAQAYQKNYEDHAYSRSNVYVDEDIQVSAPMNAGKKEVSEDEIAEDIEFEELSTQ